MNLVFDIETVGCEIEELAESQQEFLLRQAEHETDHVKKELLYSDAKRYLSLYPLTAKVISIGLLDVVSEKVIVLFEEGNDSQWINEETDVTYKPMSEAEMLTKFWIYVSKSTKLISFNGRNFDLPFLMMRSAIHKIKSSKNLLKNRYDISQHIDLLEQFTFYGVTRKFNLDFYCKSFGVDSPKSEGITGMEVKELYKAGRMKEIAIYCGKDIRATFELYKIWDEYLNVK